MGAMQGFARMVIQPGKLEEFKRLAAKCVEIVRTKDTGTLQYELYLSEDQSECLVFERYRDSEAGLEHLENIAEMMNAFAGVATISGEVCGNPSPELKAMLEKHGVPIYAPLQSPTAKG
jgi:quinol monooxygenase YgiN